MISCQSAQAVGAAVCKNPWLIIVPCHRVLPSSGHIGNYAAGEDAKRFLLHLTLLILGIDCYVIN